MYELFNIYIAGLLVNLIAGFLGWFLIRKLVEWLPSSADLHERFRAVALEKQATRKIVELTPLLFISFYWLFLANLIWVLITGVTEILSWPHLLLDTSTAFNLHESITDFFRKMVPGLIWGRSILFLFLTGYAAFCFYRGLQIAKQCWEVYRTINPRSGN